MLNKLELIKKNLEIKESTKLKSNNKVENFDPKILDFVIILNYIGINTFSSCQGHPEDSNSRSFHPYIVFCHKDVENFKPQNSINNLAKNDLINSYLDMVKQQEIIINYLDKFYKTRQTPLNNRLIVSSLGLFRGIIQPYSTTVLINKSTTQEEQLRLNNIFLKEVYDFTEFLKRQNNL